MVEGLSYLKKIKVKTLSQIWCQALNVKTKGYFNIWQQYVQQAEDGVTNHHASLGSE